MLALFKTVVYRAVLPICVFAAAVLRPSFICLIYLVLAIAASLLPSTSQFKPVGVGVRCYHLLLFIFSICTTIAQIAFQINFTGISPGSDCDDPSKRWLRQVGFIKIPNTSDFDYIRVILPEIIMLCSSAASLIVVYCVPHQVFVDASSSVRSVRPSNGINNSSNSNALHIVSRALIVGLKRLSNAAIFIFIGLVGCLQPSALNFVYFASFCFISLWYSLYVPIRHAKYNTFKLGLILYAALHLCLIYVYQIEKVEELLPAEDAVPRIVGLSTVLMTNCSEPSHMLVNSSITWNILLNPISIVILYALLVAQLSWTLNGTRTYLDEDDTGSSVHEERRLVDEGHITESTLLPSTSSVSSNSPAPGPTQRRLLDNEDGVAGGTESVPMRKLTSQVIDKQKISQIFHDPGRNPHFATIGLIALFSFLVEKFYVFALISIMAWALLYHSLFGLVLLIWACVIWINRDTRRASFRHAVLIEIYIQVLLLIQYVWCMDMDFLPTAPIHSDDVDVLSMIGFIRYQGADAFIVTSIKLLLSLPVFVLYRLKRREAFYERLSEHERVRRLNYGTFGTHNPPGSAAAASLSGVTVFSKFVYAYWIFLVAFVLLLQALWDRPCFINIGFFSFWAFGVLVFKLSFRLFRGTVYLFWTILVIYTSAVIIAIYTYQFKNFPELIDIPKNWAEDIGLIHYADEKGEHDSIFVRLLLPISLFLVTVLQMKFFHDQWSVIVQPVRQPIRTDGEASNAEDYSLDGRIVFARQDIVNIIWSALEIHIPKIVFIVIMAIASKNLNALYVPVVILLSVGICMPAAMSQLIGIVLTSYMAIAAIAKMFFHLNFIPRQDIFAYSATECNRTTSIFEWAGFNDNASMWSELGGFIVSIIMLAAQSIVVYRQRTHRTSRNIPPSMRWRIFPNVSPITYDHSLMNCLKFFADFGFYKFGLEICLIMLAINAWIRMDMLGVVSIIWLGIFALSKRAFTRAIFPLFVCYEMCLLPIQFAVYVGLPPNLCIEYPWSMLFENAIKSRNLLIWLGLSDYSIQWTDANLFADFFLLLIASCQAAVFRVEGDANMCGNNDSIYKDGKYEFKRGNPNYDFVSTQRSFVDYFKKFLFLYAQWLTLVAVMIAGLGGTSLFALGYLCLAFWILWSGNNLYIMKDHNKTIKKFMVLLGYTIFSMFCKVALQVVGCVFLGGLYEINFKCIIRQLFSIICVNTLSLENFSQLFDKAVEFDKDCPVSAAETRIGFDTVALAFLVFQLRIFHSWYFQHAMTDFRAEIVMANRGVVLANQLVEKEMKEQTLQQDRKFDAIKTRTKDIRSRYEAQQALNGRTFEPKTYGQAKRAGDYYMFDYEPDEEQLEKPIESFVPEVDPEGSQFKKLDPTQLVYTAATQDLDLARSMKQVEKAEKIEDNEERRMIAAVSTDDDIQETQEDGEQPKKDEHGFFVNGMRFIVKIIYNFLDWTAVFLNKRSREHRYVAYVLGKEKERLKSEYGEMLSDSAKDMTELRNTVSDGQLHVVRSESDIDRMENEALDNWQKRNIFARLFNAFADCINAYSDIICFVLAVLAHASCAGLITMPLPVLVFVWGTLSNPRPSKMFWIVLIAYTEFIIVTKFIFQFGFFSFNRESERTMRNKDNYAWNKILGLEKKDYYAFFDVFLLIFLFYHRYNLRRLGLWKDANVSDTFSANSASVDPEELRVAVESGTSAQPNEAADDIVEQDTDEKKGPIARFLFQLFHPKFRYIRDLYPFMFAIDIICFFIITFGYSSFGEGGSGNVVSDIQSNRIPLTFVVMLVSLTLMIVIDRALYLRKAVYCKLAYQLITVVFLHIWIFLVLPSITKRDASANSIASFLYFVKCMYLLVSAWQIRNGYPPLCIGNLLTHSYGMTNMIFFKVFMAVPFLFELRTAIDWTWTDTSMPIFDFFNMENFYAVIYSLKCNRAFETKYPAPRGERKGSLIKYLMGVPMILAIVLIIWCPLIAFSLLNRIGMVLTPDTAKMTIAVEGYPALFSIEAQGNELRSLTAQELDLLKKGFSLAFIPGVDNSVQKSRSAVSFLEEYTEDDVLKILFRPESQTMWDVSDPSFNALLFALKNETNDMQVQVHLSLTRPRQDKSKEPVTHTSEFSIKMARNSTIRLQLIGALSSNTTGNFTIPFALPPYVVIPNEGEVTAADVLLNVISQMVTPPTKSGTYANLTLFFNNFEKMWRSRMAYPTLNKTLTNSSDLFLPIVKTQYPGGGGADYVELIALVDRTFPSFFAKYVQGGIIAMYLALVIVVGKVLRGLFTNTPLDVIVTEIPNPDLLLKLCQDLYLVREAKDFVLEQDLYAKLIFLFRSPATLIKWTRYKVKDE